MKTAKEITQNIKFDNIPDGSPMFIVFPLQISESQRISCYNYKNLSGDPPLSLFAYCSFMFHKNRLDLEKGYYFPLANEFDTLYNHNCDFTKINYIMPNFTPGIPLDLCIFENNTKYDSMIQKVNSLLNKAKEKMLELNIEYSKKIAENHMKVSNLVHLVN